MEKDQPRPSAKLSWDRVFALPFDMLISGKDRARRDSQGSAADDRPPHTFTKAYASSISSKHLAKMYGCFALSFLWEELGPGFTKECSQAGAVWLVSQTYEPSCFWVWRVSFYPML